MDALILLRTLNEFNSQYFVEAKQPKTKEDSENDELINQV